MTEYYQEPYAGTCNGCDRPLTTHRTTPMGEAAPETLWVRCSDCGQVTRLERDHE